MRGVEGDHVRFVCRSWSSSSSDRRVGGRGAGGRRVGGRRSAGRRSWSRRSSSRARRLSRWSKEAPMDSDPRHWITALRASHDRLASMTRSLDVEELNGPSYDSEWTIAQVLSHLGSQAEIFSLFLDAGLEGADPPGHRCLPADLGCLERPVGARASGRQPQSQRGVCPAGRGPLRRRARGDAPVDVRHGPRFRRPASDEARWARRAHLGCRRRPRPLRRGGR